MLVSDNPKILNVTSLQLTEFLCNSNSNSSLDIIVELFSILQINDSSKIPCSIPK